MHFAVEGGHVDAIDALVQLGNRLVDTLDLQEKMSIHYAARNGHVDAFKLSTAWAHRSIMKTTSDAPQSTRQRGMGPLACHH